MEFSVEWRQSIVDAIVIDTMPWEGFGHIHAMGVRPRNEIPTTDR